MINAEMITLAREDRGLTQRELAEKLGVSPALLSKIEAGLREPTDSFMDLLCATVELPAAFFQQNDSVYGLGNSLLYHKKRRSMTARALSTVHAQINIARMHIRRLLEAAELEHPPAIPSYDLSEFDGGPAEIARAIRAAWLVPRGPVKNVTSLLEDAGGIVIGCDFPTHLIDGLSHAVPGEPPLFFFNRCFPGDRVRRTLAHELGHVVMHRFPNPRMEDEAEEFASEFLMPADDIRASLRGLTFEKLAALKRYWRVSMGSLLRRAHDLGTITQHQYEFFWMLFGKRGYRTAEPPEVAVATEEPSTLSQLVDYHRAELEYSWEDLATLLNSTAARLRTQYAPQRSLRAVR